jgi:hypothetical protein
MIARRNVVRSGHALVLLALGMGCAADSAETPSDQDVTNVAEDRLPVQAISSDLRLGDEGPAVSALHSYLTRYGYFPSEALARQYARWQPIVAEAPAYQDVFDEQTEAAVFALQRQNALEPTGYVDAATRAMLHRGRCGTPDGVASVENEPSDEKFFFFGGKIDNSAAIKWNLRQVGSGLGLEAAQVALRAGFASWAAETQLSFIEAHGRTQTIEVTWAPLTGDNVDALAIGAAPSSGSNVTFNSNKPFSTANPSPAGAFDVQTVFLHELGHAFGLAHSTIAGSTMLPGYGVLDRVLHRDDKVAISALYDTWALKPGKAKDIAAGDAGVVWAIGNGSAGNNNFTIHQWNGSSWNQVNGAAVRIAVRGTEPWVVDAQNRIWRRRNGAWGQVAGCATDIGASLGTNDVWVIACGGVVHKRNEALNRWDPTDGTGIRIAVTTAGIPWVVQANGNIFERTTSSPTGSGLWTQRTGCARDIGAFNHVWITNCTTTTGGTKIQVWQQNGEITGAHPQPEVNKFFDVTGAATNISVGPFGPWVTNSNFEIFQQDKPGTQN